MHINIGDYVRMLKCQHAYHISVGDIYEIIDFTHRSVTLQLKTTVGNLSRKYIVEHEDDITESTWAVIVERANCHLDISSLI